MVIGQVIHFAKSAIAHYFHKSRLVMLDFLLHYEPPETTRKQNIKNPVRQRYVVLGCLACAWRKTIQMDEDDVEACLTCPECGSRAITRLVTTPMSNPENKAPFTEGITNVKTKPWWKFWM